MDFRCAALSAGDDEPLAGTAPTETRWLFVEQAGSWTPKVTLVHADARVQLIRRYGGATSRSVRVFHFDAGTGVVRAGFVDDVAQATSLDPADLAPYDGPLWMVCTHGRRDVCCAERGRPVAAALAARWPHETWETTHLGGHRFAATLLALPWGIALGRVGADSAVDACEDLLAGRLPPDVLRGRVGTASIAQVAEQHVRLRDALRGMGEVSVRGVEGDEVELATPGGAESLRLVARHTQRRQSCGDDTVKQATSYDVVGPGASTT